MSGTYDSGVFSQTAEALLGGQFICQFAHEEAFELLGNEIAKEQMERLLRQLGRTLRSTADQRAYYCALSHLDGGGRREAIRLQFDTVINQMESLTRVLKVVMDALQKDSTIAPGDILRKGEILDVIERTPAYASEIDRLAQSNTFKTTRSEVSDKLSAVFSGLEKEGYLVRGGGRGDNIYIATGKWSYLYEVLDFIHTHEQLDTSEDDVDSERDQMELPT